MTADAGAELAMLRAFAIFAVMVPGVEGLEIRALRIYQLPEATRPADDRR